MTGCVGASCLFCVAVFYVVMLVMYGIRQEREFAPYRVVNEPAGIYSEAIQMSDPTIIQINNPVAMDQ